MQILIPLNQGWFVYQDKYITQTIYLVADCMIPFDLHVTKLTIIIISHILQYVYNYENTLYVILTIPVHVLIGLRDRI